MVAGLLTGADQPFYGKEQRSQYYDNGCPYNQVIPPAIGAGAMRDPFQHPGLIALAYRTGNSSHVQQEEQE